MAVRDATQNILGTPVTITVSSGTATLDCLKGDTFIITVSTDVILSLDNTATNKEIKLIVLTSGTTSRNLIFGANFKSQGVYRTNKSSGIYDVLTFYANGTDLIEYGARNRSLYTPASESGSILMLEADTYSQSDATNITTSWLDQSPLARDCTVTNTPTFETNTINGLPVIKFGSDSTDNFNLPDLSSLTAGSIYLVWSVTDPSLSGGNVWGTSGNNSHYWYDPDGKIYDDFGSTVRKNALTTITTPLSTWHVLHIYSAPSDWAMYQNTSLVHQTATNTVGFPSAPKIGVNGVPVGMKMELYGVYMFNNKPDLQTDKRIRDYIKSRTGVG